MKEHGQWVELAGHDYVMDLIADLELPSDFPKHKSYFIISSDDPAKVRANAGLSVHKNIQTHVVGMTKAEPHFFSLLTGLCLAVDLTRTMSSPLVFLSAAAPVADPPTVYLTQTVILAMV